MTSNLLDLPHVRPAELSRDELAEVIAVLTRRKIIGVAVGAAVLAELDLSAGVQSDPASPAATGWSYTDIHGETVSLPHRPERIVAMITPAAALWDFGIRPAGVFAWEAMVKPDGDDPAWGNIDATALTNVSGGDAGDLDPERTLSLDPDLIITTKFDDEAAPYVQIDPSVVDSIRQIAPVVAVYQRGPAEENLLRIAALAAALGADLSSPENLAAQQRFEATVAEFKGLAEAKGDLTVLVISPYADQYDVVAPRDFDDLAWFAELGLNLAATDAPLGTFFESHSAEQALTYPADIVLVNNIADRLTAAELRAHPTYGRHPAIAAGQIGE